jgi:hypothetical protein
MISAKERVEEKFGVGQMIDSYEELLAGVAKGQA